MLIHIGHKIKEVLHQKRIKIKEFSEKINRSRNVIYDIFERETIDTGLLEKISEVLDHDFFQYYVLKNQSDIIEDINVEYLTSKQRLCKDEKDVSTQLKECSKELERTKTEITYLKKIIFLQEEKMKNCKCYSQKVEE